MKLESGRLKKAAPWVLGGLTGAFLFANFAGSAYFHYNFLRPKRFVQYPLVNHRVSGYA